MLEIAGTAADVLSDLVSGGGKNDGGFADTLRRYQALAEESKKLEGGNLEVQQRARAAMELESADAHDNVVRESLTPESTPSSRALEDMEESSAKQNEQQTNAPLEQAPQSTAHSDNGILYEVGEVGFTQQELSELRDSLLKEGLAPETLSALEQLASHPHGATLGQLLALMHGSVLSGKPNLSAEDKQNLLNFADKIDSSGTLGKKMLSLLENGQGLDAWNLMRGSLESLDNITLLAGDVTALGKAFNLSKDTLSKILAQFGDSDGLMLSPGVFNALMVPAQQELQNRDGQKNKLAQALESHLQPLIVKARNRAESERKAAKGADRRTQQSEILIRDKFMDKFHNEVAGIEKDTKHATQPAHTANLKPADEHLLKDKPQDFSGKSDMGEWQKNMVRVREENPLGNSLRDGRQNGRQADRENGRDLLLSRIEASAPRRTHVAQNNSAAFGVQADMQTQAGTAAAARNSASAPLARQAAQQVEQGFLTTLNNGGRRLELQLNPGELGAVTLVLTTGKGGEVSALIRSEKTETAELMSRQLDIIRTNLEQQGVKVDKLEVQSGPMNNQEQQLWQGMEQHNSMLEQQERRDNLERLRRLGRRGESGSSAAQEMQNIPHTAEISGQGLHLVA